MMVVGDWAPGTKYIEVTIKDVILFWRTLKDRFSLKVILLLQHLKSERHYS